MLLVETLHNTILQSCTYLLYDTTAPGAYLVDCGDAEPIWNALQSHGKQLEGIFLTHCHYDHVFGLNEVMSHCRNAKVYASSPTIDGLFDPKVNLSKYHGAPFVFEFEKNLIGISNESKIEILGNSLVILETPGHDSGCLSYLIGDNLFTGDSYIPGFPVFTKWKRSNKSEALKNETMLKEMSIEKNLNVYSGHYLE